VAESKIKPAIFNAGDHVDQLIAAVQDRDCTNSSRQ